MEKSIIIYDTKYVYYESIFHVVVSFDKLLILAWPTLRQFDFR